MALSRQSRNQTRISDSAETSRFFIKPKVARVYSYPPQLTILRTARRLQGIVLYGHTSGGGRFIASVCSCSRSHSFLAVKPRCGEFSTTGYGRLEALSPKAKTVANHARRWRAALRGRRGTRLLLPRVQHGVLQPISEEQVTPRRQ